MQNHARRIIAIFAVIAFTTSCYVYNHRKRIGDAHAAFSSETTDDDRLRALLWLREECHSFPSDEERPSECSTDFESEIGHFHREYHGGATDNVIMVPRHSFLAPGLYPWSAGTYRLCGVMFNLGEKTIVAVEVDVIVSDHFNKAIGNANLVVAVAPIPPFNQGRHALGSTEMCTRTYRLDRTAVRTTFFYPVKVRYADGSVWEL